jgi:hypothetical protein
MEVVPEEMVVWVYRHKGHTYYVTARVVQAGQVRTRIRVQRTNGQTVLRWVKPANLRPQTTRSVYSYPF